MDTFNLDLPPNFRGLHPDLPITMYTRNLPHWRQEGATYAVTFRLSDSLPKVKLQQLKSMKSEWEAKHPPPRSEDEWSKFAETMTSSVEKWLDRGHGDCHFRQAVFANELARSILHFQDQRYFVSCYAIMPNHCHLMIRPHAGFELESLVGAIKGVVARYVNETNGTSGSLWQQESFDRIIRDGVHLFREIQYFGNNPRLACLPESMWYRWVHPDWDACGWGFRDP